MMKRIRYRLLVKSVFERLEMLNQKTEWLVLIHKIWYSETVETRKNMVSFEAKRIAKTAARKWFSKF